MLNTIPTKQLFDALVSKLIIDLKENEALCPYCNGLRMTYEESDGKATIKNCQKCYTGKVYKCEFCGQLNRSDHCHCKQASDKRSDEIRMKEYHKFQEALKTATIIPIKEYKGWLKSLYDEERVVKADDYAEEYLDNFDVVDSPKYVCASVGENAFTLDIKDIISDKSENGYDEMYEHLNMSSPILDEVQVLLDKWVSENSSAMKVYCETDKVIVDLTELYEEGMRL